MSCGLWHQLGLPPPTPGQWLPSGPGWGCFSFARMRLKGPCRASCPLSSLGPFPAPQPLPPGGFSSGNLQTGFWDLSSSLTPEEHRMKYLLTFLSNSNRVYIHPEGAVPPPLPVPLAPALELLAPPLLGSPSSQAGPPLLTLHLRLALHYADPPGLEAFSSPSSPSPGCHPVGACRPAPPPGRGQCRGGRAAHTIFLPHPKGPWTREDPAAWEPVRPLWSDSQTGKGQTPRAPGPLPTSAPERRLFRRLFWAPSIPKDAACGGSPAHTQPPEPLVGRFCPGTCSGCRGGEGHSPRPLRNEQGPASTAPRPASAQGLGGDSEVNQRHLHSPSTPLSPARAPSRQQEASG